MGQKIVKRIEVPTGGRWGNSDPSFSPAILEALDFGVVYPADDLAPVVFSAITLDNTAKSLCTASLCYLYIDKRVGVGDVNLTLPDHFYLYHVQILI